VVPIAILLITLSKDVVQIIYGSTYNSAPIFLAIYCLIYLLTGFGSLTLASFYNGLGETKTTLKIEIITFIIVIAFSPILTNLYGVLGLISSLILAKTTGTLYGLNHAKRKFHIYLDARELVKVYLVAAISVIPLLLFHFAAFTSLVKVIGGGLLSLFIYITLVPLAKIVSTSELQTANRITQKIRLLAFLTKPIIAYQQKILQSCSFYKKSCARLPIKI
jgi:O-antigen/teichoic acid export membrane protein